MAAARDHGGGLDAACALHGGRRTDWLDLSTGINPTPYPLPPLPQDAWTALPDAGATQALIAAARGVWRVPSGAEILPAPGASALIARLPGIAAGGPVHIPGPTYNEHAAAFAAAGATVIDAPPAPGRTCVVVSPNNPDGRWWTAADLPEGAPLTVIDESFADIDPARSMVALAERPGVIILKSFGKFWGLAGLRLGFAIGHPQTLAPLRDALGPWPVSGPALAIGAAALADGAWTEATRVRLTRDAARLDGLMAPHGRLVGGTPLFRLYETTDAAALRDRLAAHRIWSRIFPYSATWLRLGLPPATGWDRVAAALA
ncbi:aminotransferase class I/II-fold pyridoxal phosphate-dependent enzyme [Jannaschia seohaensis]|uniref:Aminotransferase n=1 Tax=Jannaschia seohaensis TaxID=475081 RepID=A0A2Y9A2S8_9RHOB|nr:aminotransferase class I/II-fold pyridoxal phosphate-dependent enzyme [Jannaschia seohaensis]PWJ22466.1 cobalamin biosynthetic protein CobC [Jannaschia seohaensis]SSA38744.1 cobalamin biosynthetic protein CobC [Jannaschia seohaensis]